MLVSAGLYVRLLWCNNAAHNVGGQAPKQMLGFLMYENKTTLNDSADAVAGQGSESTKKIQYFQFFVFVH